MKTMIQKRILLLLLILTPSCKYINRKDKYHPGESQPSFDEQFVRDYHESLAWVKTLAGML